MQFLNLNTEKVYKLNFFINIFLNYFFFKTLTKIL